MLNPGARFILYICVCLLIVSCKGKEEPAQVRLSFQKQRTNVLLITLDTVRADALQIYDPLGTPVPNLEKLADRGIVFERSIAQAPYTLPSHASMFTGQFTISHGVIDNLRGLLPENVPTLAECFRNQGYQTAGFTGALILSRDTEINRGFDYYDDYFSKSDRGGGSLNRIERKAEDVFLSFQHWYEQRDPKKNFFAFVHFYDAHAPYEPPGSVPAQSSPRERYLGEIRYVDSFLGKLFDSLDKQNGVIANTIILVESDHGEMFEEHREIGHGFFVYEPALRVPFILYLPSLQKSGAEKIKIPDTVQLIDIAPTLLDLANISVPKTMQGESLVPLLQGNPKKNQLAFSESYMPALELGANPILSVQDTGYKYIETSRPELYDLRNDSAETTNLIDSKKSIAKNFKQELVRYKSNYALQEKSQREVSAEETEQFAALGYLGGNVPREQWDSKKDPKDYIDVWNQLNNVNTLINKKHYAEALAVIKQIKSVLPSKRDSLLLNEAECYSNLGDLKKAEDILTSLHTSESLLPLARIYLRTGRKDQAIEVYRPEITKDVELYKLYNFILILRMADRKQEALRFLDDLRSSGESDVEVSSFLAEASYVLDRWNDVEKYALELISQRPWEWKWYGLLAESYEKRKDYGKALQLLEKTESRFAQRPVYWLRIGVLFRQTNQSAKALNAFSRMIELSPRDP
ncbi:sulfatase-like hydrolase/transferase, partial [bacterium]|nr:sulfatase-like hydrolase/transferase [bacterium]